jgi:hypothetical protein
MSATERRLIPVIIAPKTNCYPGEVLGDQAIRKSEVH